MEVQLRKQMCVGAVILLSLGLVVSGQQRAPPGVNPGQYQQGGGHPPPPPPPPQQPQQFQGQPQQFQGQPQQFQGQPQQFQGQPQQFQGQPQQFQGHPQQVPQVQAQPGQPAQNVRVVKQMPDGQQVLHRDMSHEREHMKEHMEVPIDTTNMSEQELQFHYFKMHDADGNNKLDGCELVKSLIHWHDGDSHEGHDHEPPPHYEDDQLAFLVDPVLKSDDVNKDGMIDYPEFIAAQLKTKLGLRETIEVQV